MTINEYAEKVAEILKEELEEDVVLAEVDKQNGQHFVGVRIVKGDACPTFYVNKYYEDDRGIRECAMDMIEALDNVAELPFDMDSFDFSFDAIKDKLTVRLLDAEKNADFLVDKVFRPLGCGLVLTADINVAEHYRSAVTLGLAESEKYEADELIEEALKNTERLYPATLVRIEDALFGNSKNLLEDDHVDGMMLVLSNEDGVLGASGLFFDGMMEKLHDKCGNYFVLPSSIHEVLIVPEETADRAEELKSIVLSANREVVESDTQLSDNVYFYDGELKVVA